MAVGTGLPLFASPFQPRGLTLSGAQTYDSGVAVLRYRVGRAAATSASA